MQHNDALTCEGAVKHASNAVAAFDSKFKEPVTERACVRFTEITTVDLHAFNEMLITDSHSHWQLVDLKPDLFAVVLNSVVHGAKHNKIVMFSQVLDHLDSERYTAWAAEKSVAGRGNPESNKEHNRAQAVFLYEMHCYTLIMVGRAGQPKGWPGSLLTGISTPARLTTFQVVESLGGELSKLNKEAATMATIPTLSHPEIALINGQVVTSSLAVADYFTKRHADVIRKIESLECSAEFRQRNFTSADYTDEQGKLRPAYQITRDGFAFLAMGFTGKRAAQFKEAYITAFNQMERALIKSPRQSDPRLHDALKNATRIRDNLDIALEVWVRQMIVQNPPIMLSGTLLDSLHRTSLVVEELKQVMQWREQK